MSNKKCILASQDTLRYGRNEGPFDHMSSLGDWLLYFLEHFVKLNTKPNIYASFRSYIYSHICPLFGSYPLNEVTEPVLQTYMNIKRGNGRLDGKDDLDVKALKEHIMVLELSFKRVIQLGIISYDPCRCMEYPKEAKREVRVLSVQEQKRLTAAITPAYRENSLLTVLITIHAGLRIGEVSILRIEDICLSRRLTEVDKLLNRVMACNEDGTVSCPFVYQTTKSSRVRKVPMNEELCEGIVKALEKKKEGAGSYGRPRTSLPGDSREQMEYCQRNHIPLKTYRRGTSLKKATLYKYVKVLQDADRQIHTTGNEQVLSAPYFYMSVGLI